MTCHPADTRGAVPITQPGTGFEINSNDLYFFTWCSGTSQCHEVWM